MFFLALNYWLRGDPKLLLLSNQELCLKQVKSFAQINSFDSADVRYAPRKIAVGQILV